MIKEQGELFKEIEVSVPINSSNVFASEISTSQIS